MAYSSVPPPSASPHAVSGEKPPAISETYWNKFQDLKKQREVLQERHLRKRARQSKRSSLKAVHTRVTSRDLLSESTPSKVKKSDDIKWEDICPYIKPNAQLLQGATTEGRDETGLESKLDDAIDKGRYDAAALLSDKISERKLACQIVTAIDVHKATEKKKSEDEARKRRKPNLKWKYEHKKRWETKSNM